MCWGRLAQIGAINQLNDIEHRRDAFWQVTALSDRALEVRSHDFH